MDQSPVKSLSVFFPCYNEADNLERVVAQALDVLNKLDIDFEVIIVDDGSTDQTGRIADELASGDEHVRALHHEKNSGYGAALQTGFRAATKDFVFYTDGDGQFDIAEMPPLLKYMEDYEIVSCYRIKRQDNMVRKLNAFFWTALVGVLFRLKIRDIDCAFKLYRRSIFDDMPLLSTGALVDTEVLARAKLAGCKIYQTGVNHYPRMAGEQTGAKLSVIFRAFKELFVLYRKIKAGQ